MNDRPAPPSLQPTTPSAPSHPRRLTRRRLLTFGGAGLLAAATGTALAQTVSASSPVGPGSPAVRAAEEARRRSGAVVRRSLRAAPATVDIGGRTVSTWAYDGALPGEGIRVTAGDELRVSLTNDLPAPTSVHWHGLALRNDMDGVPGLTMDAVAPGAAHDYRFVVPDPGTYWFHPHVGVQLDTGLMAPLVVEDPAEPGRYDQEAVLVLDDWTDGLGPSPTEVLATLRRKGMDMSGDTAGDGATASGGMKNMGSGGMEGMGGGVDAEHPLGTDTGDVAYAAHLVNGRLPTAPTTITTAPGRRVRLRIVNGAADTPYQVAVGGHRLVVTHADGFPVVPVEVDTLIIGMGERYDVLLTAGDGAFPIVAVPVSRDDAGGMAVLRSAGGAAPDPAARPAELDGRLLRYADLVPADAVRLAPREPDRELELRLAMVDGGRRWSINGALYGDHEPLPVEQGERVRLRMVNASTMFHPMHVHGHTFALAGPDGAGVRKDTVNVLPMQTVAVDLQADNPGQWMVHCHNAYHAEQGMMTTLSYQA